MNDELQTNATETVYCYKCLRVVKARVVRGFDYWAWYCLDCGSELDHQFIDDDPYCFPEAR